MNIDNDVSSKLIMYPHLGSVDIEIYDKQISVLPAHMFCLELFINPNIELSYDYVFEKVKENMSNYTNDFIKNIIDSLIGPILVKKDDLLCIRNDINNVKIDINMICNYKEILIEEMKEELCHNKIDIIKTNINHFIKLFDKITIDTMYDLVSKNIKLFSVNKKLFDDAIQSLIKHDYIQYIDSNYLQRIQDN
jgi:hypothetical protein